MYIVYGKNIYIAHGAALLTFDEIDKKGPKLFIGTTACIFILQAVEKVWMEVNGCEAVTRFFWNWISNFLFNLKRTGFLSSVWKRRASRV